MTRKKVTPKVVDFSVPHSYVMKPGSYNRADLNRRLASEWRGRFYISQEKLDELAEEKLTGKYNTEQDNLCNICFTYKSNNGTCNCIGD